MMPGMAPVACTPVAAAFFSVVGSGFQAAWAIAATVTIVGGNS